MLLESITKYIISVLDLKMVGSPWLNDGRALHNYVLNKADMVTLTYHHMCGQPMFKPIR